MVVPIPYRCVRCSSLIGEMLPGGVFRIVHKGRETLYFTDGATGYIETTCPGSYRGRSCLYKNRVMLATAWQYDTALASGTASA